VSRRAGAALEVARLITRSQVAALLGVSSDTVTRWAREGRLASHVTLGGHHRFDRELVEQIRRASARRELGPAN
jgi:excisionase family DNA binding protein